MTYQAHQDDSFDLIPGDVFFSDHVTRYWWAQALAEGKDVLDCACGHGYGSYILSHRAKQVLGIDLNQESLEKAKKVFHTRPNLKFSAHDVTQVQKLENTFDVITAFEVIEHLPPEQTQLFLINLAASLRPGGVLLLSTPNHEVVKKSGVEIPDFHINNLSSRELKKVLSQHFFQVEMLGQFRQRGAFYNFLFSLDFFNLRHTLRMWRKNFVLNVQNFPSTRRKATLQQDFKPAQEIDINLFAQPPEEMLQYRFSPWHWRQAGLSVAVCRRPKT